MRDDNLTDRISALEKDVFGLKSTQFTGAGSSVIHMNQTANTYDVSKVVSSSGYYSIAFNFHYDHPGEHFFSPMVRAFRNNTSTPVTIDDIPTSITQFKLGRSFASAGPNAIGFIAYGMLQSTNTFYFKFFVQSTDTGYLDFFSVNQL